MARDIENRRVGCKPHAGLESLQRLATLAMSRSHNRRRRRYHDVVLFEDPFVKIADLPSDIVRLGVETGESGHEI